MTVLEALQISPALFSLTAGLLGLIVGSFLNVVIHRLPIMMERQWRSQCAELLDQPDLQGAPEPLTLWAPRSRCPQCGHVLRVMENLPVISYLVQRGRCTECGDRISIQYPFVEILSAGLASVAAWHFGFGLPAAGAIILTWALIALSAIDFRHHLLPDCITLPFLWLGLGFALFGTFADLRSCVIGAMVGYLSLWSVYHLFRLLTGKEGMGYGDFKLLAMLGAWQGWQHLVVIVIASSVVGAVVGLCLILVRGRDRNVPMPFGPFLAVAGWITLLWGDRLNSLYMDWIGL